MTDMSPQLQTLVTAAKVASLPSEAIQARVHEALEARLGQAAFLAEGSTTAIGSTTPFLALKIAAVSAAGIALVGGATWMYWNGRESPDASGIEIRETAVASALSETPTEPQPSVVLQPSQELAAATSSEPKSPTGNAGKTRNRDRLAEEVSLISRAQSEISSARAGSALTLLDEHARKFPNGILRDERIAARIQALCALGRTAEADAQLNRLSPRSLHHRGQTQSACGERLKSTVGRTTGSNPSKP